jgi:hypothetical protein
MGRVPALTHGISELSLSVFSIQKRMGGIVPALEGAHVGRACVLTLRYRPPMSRCLQMLRFVFPPSTYPDLFHAHLDLMWYRYRLAQVGNRVRAR